MLRKLICFFRGHRWIAESGEIVRHWHCECGNTVDNNYIFGRK